MAVPRILPTPDEILTPGINKLVELRPRAQTFLNPSLRGNYGKIFVGLRAQAALMIARLASLVQSGRLPFATGTDLIALLQSEYDITQSFDEAKATGEVVLTRTAQTYPAGVIPAGTKFERTASSSAPVPYRSAVYVSTQPVFVPVGATTVTIPVEAAEIGTDGNTRLWLGLDPPAVSVTGALFDANFVGSYVSAGGGRLAVDETFLRQFALAYYTGKDAPTNTATKLAALEAGAVRCLPLDDKGTGISVAFVADGAWGSSSLWAGAIAQRMTDAGRIGFGCQHDARTVTNVAVGIACNVTLRRTEYTFNTLEIEKAISEALRAYFDDRPDWNIWRTSSIKGVISRAHRKILTCTSVTLTDTVSQTTLTEPELPSYPLGSTIYHYYLVDNALKPTFASPT